MPSPSALIPVIEGFVGSSIGSGLRTQNVSLWVELVKATLRSTDFRDLTDLQFELLSSVTAVGIPPVLVPTHLIADLWEISGDLGTDTGAYCGWTDALTDTFAMATALTTQEDVVTIFSVRDLGVSTISEYYPHIYLAGSAGVEASTTAYGSSGIALTTGLTAWADGKDDNDVTAASCRVWVLFRD
jgi:hypothetical protein